MTAQLPRRSLLWVMGALLLVTAPHLPHLPVGVPAVLGFSLLWRYRVYQGRWPFPSLLVKVLLVLISFIGVGLHFRTINGLDPAISLLVIAAGFKTLEMRVTRDYLVACFVGYFLAASQLLFEQEIPYAALALAGLVGVTAAMVARHQREPAPGFPSPLALAAKMLAQALPLMLVLFVVFPRIAPLWSMPQSKAAAKTGPSDTVSPGDIAQLSGSNALAFRASFDGPVPQQRELYWRGLVLSEFDGREWSVPSFARLEADLALRGLRKVAVREPKSLPGSVSVDYRVILEPSNRQWAYALGLPRRWDEGLRIGSDFRLISTSIASQRKSYSVLSELDATLEPELPPLRRALELRLPEDVNPRARALAAQWRAEAASDRDFVATLLGWFREEEFIYTLTPPLLGSNSVDDFLFGERRGFCEHYASAFTFLARAAGIPARVVVGYQGGERSPYENYLLVHEFDAHAWSEVWLPGEGWTRVDPTAAVAPGRIESSLSDVLSDEFLADSPLAFERYRGVPLIAILRMRWDLVTYQWAKLVLQYDAERQAAVLDRVLGRLTPARLIGAMLLIGGAAMLLVAISLFGAMPRRNRDPATRSYLRMCRALAREGLERRSGEGPMDYCRRVSSARPDLANTVRLVTDDFLALGYAGPNSNALLARLRRTSWRFSLARALSLNFHWRNTGT